MQREKNKSNWKSFHGLLYDDLYDFIMGTAELEQTSDRALVWYLDGAETIRIPGRIWSQEFWIWASR